MKGRFRKGKKAAHLGKKNILAQRYDNWMSKRAEAEIKAFMTYFTAKQSQFQIAAISAKPIPFGAPEEMEIARREKAIAIAGVVVNSAQAIGNIWK
jgi:hypothetical protein